MIMNQNRVLFQITLVYCQPTTLKWVLRNGMARASIDLLINWDNFVWHCSLRLTIRFYYRAWPGVMAGHNYGHVVF